PIIGDEDLNVSKLYDMLPAEEAGTSQGRTAATNQTVRTVYLIRPDKLIKAMLVYPMSTRRNLDELLRPLDSIQLTSEHTAATPVRGGARGGGAAGQVDAASLFHCNPRGARMNPLDRPIWSALTTRQPEHSVGGARARRYRSDIEPFIAAANDEPESLVALAD